jgi:hypothetical protein
MRCCSLVRAVHPRRESRWERPTSPRGPATNLGQPTPGGDGNGGRWQLLCLLEWQLPWTRACSAEVPLGACGRNPWSIQGLLIDARVHRPVPQHTPSSTTDSAMQDGLQLRSSACSMSSFNVCRGEMSSSRCLQCVLGLESTRTRQRYTDVVRVRPTDPRSYLDPLPVPCSQPSTLG